MKEGLLQKVKPIALIGNETRLKLLMILYNYDICNEIKIPTYGGTKTSYRKSRT